MEHEGDVRVVAWERDDEDRGHSVGRLERLADGWVVHGTEVLAGPHHVGSCGFRVEVDAGWVTRGVEVWSLSEAGERRVELRAGADRRWTRDGVDVPALAGCVDVDVAATPVTNTLAIRRLLDLEVGASRTAPVAWVDVPALQVTRVEQTYRRLGPRRWEHADDTHGAFVLDVDDDGLVRDYQGFARRVHGG